MVCVMVALGSEAMTVLAVRQCAKDSKEGKALVHMPWSVVSVRNYLGGLVEWL